ncbi:glycosyltransferase [Halodesulfovibrio marinisediminis]|uniref:Glycosyltransferase 2-like domain-containing protein n=1 Tax=Halodesulfovibrio marinisediminis DSM 17456 TaxID=1121457 RepID=A0A1N6IBQ3_9BACT|nr:glycosyltransferase [Halodesulfovibrio marinisediminis]SIO29443.1 hypothetical protein SAMN02745161_2602 [Halodesulfovibrio marinisediminis DSM 17456]
MTTTTLSILVSSISSTEAVALTLASFTNLPKDLECEILITADSEATPAISALIEEVAPLLPVRPAALELTAPISRARAFNLAADNAKGGYLLFLEAGTQITAESISPLLQHLSDNSSTGIAAPLLICPQSGRVQNCGTTFTPSLRPQPLFASFPATHPAVTKQRSFQAVPVNGMFMRAETFKEIGQFDTKYKTGMEVLDLCCAVRNNEQTIELIPQSTLLEPDKNESILEDDLSIDTMRLNDRCKGCFGPDKHLIAKKEGYVFTISPWLESYMTLTPEREQELNEQMMQSPDPSTCLALIIEEPLWQTGYVQLAAYLESTGKFEEACGIRLLQTFFFPMLPLYRKLAAVAEAAQNESLLQMANDKLGHIDNQLEDISALTKKAAGLANWARKAKEKELQELYEGWLKDLGLL